MHTIKCSRFPSTRIKLSKSFWFLCLAKLSFKSPHSSSLKTLRKQACSNVIYNGFLLGWSSTLKKEHIPSSETSTHIRTTRRNMHNYQYGKFKFDSQKYGVQKFKWIHFDQIPLVIQLYSEWLHLMYWLMLSNPYLVLNIANTHSTELANHENL
jgi:hypothetical protein